MTGIQQRSAMSIQNDTCTHRCLFYYYTHSTHTSKFKVFIVLILNNTDDEVKKKICVIRLQPV